MILADKIMCLRKQKGWSQEELANRLNVSRQSVSKWESDASVPEMDKVVQLSIIFSVTTDYLLKDGLEEEKGIYDEVIISKNKVAWKQGEVDKFFGHVNNDSRGNSIGVALCILGVASLIYFGGRSEYGVLGLDENIAIIIGMVSMFLMIAIAVAIFIVTNNSREEFQVAYDREVYMDNSTKDYVRERKTKYKASFNLGIIIGVVLCILAVLPLIVGSLSDLTDSNLVLLLVIMFVVITIAVYILVRVSLKMEGYELLLSKNIVSKQEKETEELTEKISTIYWLLVVGIYLGWSFYTNKWETTWIVWPVAGVLYGIIPSIIGLKEKNKY